MKKIIASIVLSFLFLNFISAQEYPKHIPQGQNETLNATESALWVLKESQFNRALSDSKELKLIKLQVEDLKKTINLHEEKETELVKLKETLTKDRDYYKEIWQTCSENTEKIGKAYKRQKIIARIAVIAVPVVFVIGLLL
ncbi:MAG: hypothetical protein KAI79_06050 [Bacteroidales bacterium]|nr:hypothetical protein [Bacteroidales bacterium]